MSTASLGVDATIVVFVLTYAGVALGRAPGLRIDRAGIALVGASLMIGLGTLSLDEALKSIDLDAIALLLGMMIIVSQLRVSGFFELAARFALRRAHSAPVLLAAIVIVTGFFSAFLVNDAICLVMAPLVIDVTRALRRNPVPYLLAVAMASNAGSAATFTGNPQNMIIGVASHLPYADFAAKLAPAAAVALALTAALIILFYREEFSTAFALGAKEPRPRWYPWQLVKGMLVTVGVIVSFFAGIPISEAALIGGSLLLLSRAVKPRKIYAGIDGGLLLMFAGLFIVVAGAEKVLLTANLTAAVAWLSFGKCLDFVWRDGSPLKPREQRAGGFDLETIRHELAGPWPGLADRSDEFHLRRKPDLDRFCRQPHRCRTGEASGSNDLFSRLLADRLAIDASESLVRHVVARMI